MSLIRENFSRLAPIVDELPLPEGGDMSDDAAWGTICVVDEAAAEVIVNELLSRELHKETAYNIISEDGTEARASLMCLSWQFFAGALSGIDMAGKMTQVLLRLEIAIVVPFHCVIFIPMSTTTSPVPWIFGSSLSTGLKKRTLSP